MKIYSLDDFDIQKDVINNPDDYVLIGKKFYKKDSKDIVKTSQGWQVFDPEKFVIDDLSGLYERIEQTFKLLFIDKKGNKKTYNAIDHIGLLNKKFEEIFYDFIDQPVNYENLKNIFLNPGGIYDKNGQRIILRIDQAHKLGYSIPLCDGTSITKKGNEDNFAKTGLGLSKDQPYRNTYIRCRTSKFKREKINLKSIANNDLTFGVEIETCAGSIPKAFFYKENLDIECTRDGSITGGEYVTGILKGDLGFYDLYKAICIISKRCNADKSCGIHVHIGNVIFNKQFINLSYILAYKIQNDLFKYLHPSRSNNLMCGEHLKEHFDVGVKAYNNFKKKDADKFFYQYLYNKMLYDRSHLTSVWNKKRGHPGNRYCGRYQNPFNGSITKEQFRYKWLNFITACFNQRSAAVIPQKKGYTFDYLTLEFRPYQASLDYAEIEDWVLFCMAFVKYVVNESYKILNKNEITVEEIFNYSYDKSVFNRFKNRKSYIGRKNTYPDGMSFSKFLKYRSKINKKTYVSNNIQEIDLKI